MIPQKMSVEEFKHLVMSFFSINYPTCTVSLGDDLVVHLTTKKGETVKSQPLVRAYDQFRRRSFKDSASSLNAAVEVVDKELKSLGVDSSGGRF